MLGTLIKVARTVAPGEKELYPAWQGMQYMHNMFAGRAKLEPLDNDAIPVFVERLRGMCSQRVKLASFASRANEGAAGGGIDADNGTNGSLNA